MEAQSPSSSLIASDESLLLLCLQETLSLTQSLYARLPHGDHRDLCRSVLLRLTYSALHSKIPSNFRSECQALNRALSLEMRPRPVIGRRGCLE